MASPAIACRSWPPSSRGLAERHHVLQFDFRGHGESGASVVTLGVHERLDVAAAVAFLRERGLGPIALVWG